MFIYMFIYIYNISLPTTPSHLQVAQSCDLLVLGHNLWRAATT